MEAQLKTLKLPNNLSTSLDRYATDFIRSPKVAALDPFVSDVSQGVYVTLHGHFYQPPRENPYIGAIERQDSAAPFHNWNDRICHECYRPNAFARILNEAGEVIEIVNNFEYLSFNIGPTLMSWLEQYDGEVYQRILDADRNSCLRLDGHGNAIAQVYNHIILPLANRQDKITQIRWGKADFQARFNREPEGMWLAEAAVDYATLEVLIAEGIKFIVLAPSQVQRCRPIAPEPDPRDPIAVFYPEVIALRTISISLSTTALFQEAWALKTCLIAQSSLPIALPKLSVLTVKKFSSFQSPPMAKPSVITSAVPKNRWPMPSATSCLNGVGQLPTLLIF
jgi:hypothetical protein